MADGTGLLGIDDDAATAWLARALLGEREGVGTPRDPGANLRIGAGALFNAAQSLNELNRPSFGPRVSAGELITAGTAGLFGGAAQQSVIEQQVLQQQQSQELARAQAVRELARQQQMQALVRSLAVRAQDGEGATPAGGPAPLLTPTAAPQGVVTSAALKLPSIGEIPDASRGWFAKAVSTVGLTPDQADVYARMVRQESGGQHRRPDGSIMVSPAGARGIAQVMPGTFAAVAQNRGITGGIDDPESNALAGAWYFKEMLDRYKGDVTRAVQAYNAGPRRVDDVIAGKSELPKETVDYQAKVLRGQAPDAVRQAGAAAISRATGAPIETTRGIMGLSPQELLVLSMLPPAEMDKVLGHILQERAKQPTAQGWQLLSREEAQAAGLPVDAGQVWQRGLSGETRGQVRRADQGGAGSVTVNMPAQAAKGLLEYDLGRLTAAREATNAGQALVPQLQAMQTLFLQNIPTGQIVGRIAPFARVLQDMGIFNQQQADKLDLTNFAESLIAQVVPQMRPVGSGATSDMDLAMFQRAAPSLVRSPNANLLMVGGMLQVREAQRREVERMDAYLRKHNGLAGYDEVQRAEPIHAFPRLPRGKSTEEIEAWVQALPHGTVFVTPDGDLLLRTKAQDKPATPPATPPVTPPGKVDEEIDRVKDAARRGRGR